MMRLKVKYQLHCATTCHSRPFPTECNVISQSRFSIGYHKKVNAKGRQSYNAVAQQDRFYYHDSLITGMHSSRMRTGRSLTVCCSLLPGGGGCCSGGVSAPGVCVCVSQHALRQTPSPPPWTEFLTHACENITLAQLPCGR